MLRRSSPTVPALLGTSSVTVPAVIAGAGERASDRFLEFFTAHIQNKNTRLACARALAPLLAWCDEHAAKTRGECEASD